MVKKKKKAKEEKRSENYFRRALESNGWTFPRRVKKAVFKLAFERRPVAGAKVWQWHDAKDSVIISRHCSSVNRTGLFF